jgi:hypothetical protein
LYLCWKEEEEEEEEEEDFFVFNDTRGQTFLLLLV